MWCGTGCDRAAWGGRTRFTRQRPQVRNLSRPPAKTPPRLDPSGRLPEDLPEDLASHARTGSPWLDPHRLGVTERLGPHAAEVGEQLPLLEHPPSHVQVGWSELLGDAEGEGKSRVQRLDHPGGHLRGGVPVVGADATATLQLSTAAALVAHQLIDHPGRDALLLQPGGEAVPQIMWPAKLQIRKVGTSTTGRALVEATEAA